MIVIDGQPTELQISNFANLEELLVRVMSANSLEDRIVTDVLVDDEAFNEIYPHQAEDIETASFDKVEIKSAPMQEMAVNITEELAKVVDVMAQGGRNVADLFRQADDAEALEIFQDLLDVTRDFMTMVGVLREEFALDSLPEFNAAAREISEVLTEISETLENEDWILMADLLEYEYSPVVNKWRGVVDSISTRLQSQAVREVSHGA